jgi:hypothetical protein
MSVLVTAIAHENAVTIDDLISAGVGIIASKAGIVGNLFFPADGQMA